MDNYNDIIVKLDKLLRSETLIKLILSRADDKNIKRTEGRIFSNKGKTYLQLETFTNDGKALHKNIDINNGAKAVVCDFEKSYRQLNILTASGELEAKRSSKSKLFVRDRLGEELQREDRILGHDRQKKHILYDGTVYDFLVLLGISDADGRIFDRRRAKFRQINRFLDYVAEIYDKLPAEGELYVLDLCCGKSYLTFAAYYYLTAVRGRKVVMTGADLKSDVIKLCSDYAERLGYDGLKFVCCDIMKLEVNRRPDIVMSLHACDTATDIVLAKAVTSGARVILSTPCCHHEMMRQINGNSKISQSLSAITDYPLLRQKLCDALTDGMRCRILEAEGYEVKVTELIDPEETPKNIMISAIYQKPLSDKKYADKMDDYHRLCELTGADPYLHKLIPERTMYQYKK